MSLKSQVCSYSLPALSEVQLLLLAVQSGTPARAANAVAQRTTLLGVATESSRGRLSDQHSNAAAVAVHSELLKCTPQDSQSGAR